ncbi:hypothetical protein QWY75_01160 [Pontixanthobacter aestiaquae]|nr:hypothetical protein [Pontixanthobacter aestiaquae]MDN3644808.1 hypothetical protein [Pontixanthobacter aestiaquae]
MPIWFELIVMMLAAYAVGLTIGWALWGRKPATDIIDSEEEAEQ